MYKKLLELKPEYYAYFAWIITIAATLGSLYYDMVLHLTPCTLCWFQRAMMYPLVFIILAGILLKDRKMFFYTVGLNIVGFGLALFQVLLTQGVFSESLNQCFNGVSCSNGYAAYFGFFTIPLQSLTAFTAIFILTRLHYLASKEQNPKTKIIEL